ncbi:MAG: hypothetical protein ACO1G9_01435 [Bacteroidota bacterium]
MKKITLFILFSIICTVSYGQDIATLQSLNARAKTIYIKAEALDQIMISLRPYEDLHGDGIDTLLMETYKIISQGYSDNNHFKQGYQVYDKYLNYRIESLQRYKTKTISNAAASIDSRKQKDDAAQVDLQNTISQLQIDIDQLGSKRSGFKKYFSFGVIVLSLIFAGLLVNYGVKFNNLKNQIKDNKDSMMSGHRLSTLGHFASGYQSETGKSFVSIENTIAQVKSELKSTTDQNLKKADQLCSVILKSTAEVKAINN